MATTEYNQDQSGLRPDLDEPWRTTANDLQGTGFDAPQMEQPRQHKMHFDDEPLPKPTTGTYGDDSMSSEQQVMPTAGSQSGYGGDVAPKSAEGYQDYRSSEPTGPVDQTRGYADPSEAFPGAPIDRKIEEPGYGHDTPTSTPATIDNTAVDGTTPKKESFVQKIMDKLPGHHKTSTPETVEDDTTMDTGTPKKGLMTKIKEKLPGHHSTTPTTPTVE